MQPKSHTECIQRTHICPPRTLSLSFAMSEFVRAFFSFQSSRIYSIHIRRWQRFDAVRTLKFCSEVTFTILQSNISHCPNFLSFFLVHDFSISIHMLYSFHWPAAAAEVCSIGKINIRKYDTDLRSTRPCRNVQCEIEKCMFVCARRYARKHENDFPMDAAATAGLMCISIRFELRHISIETCSHYTAEN